MKNCSNKNCGQENPQAISEFSKNKNQKSGLAPRCKSCDKISYINNRESILAQKREYNVRISERSKIYCQKNRERRSKNNKEWYTKNRESNSRKNKERRHSDPIFRFLDNMRKRLASAFFSKGKSKKTLELLGCNVEIAKHHIESLFQPGMTWHNYGEWEIDHKIPLCIAIDIQQLEKLCHYTNLQPLWKIDNRRKGGRI
jgi:hypothetical protein